MMNTAIIPLLAVAMLWLAPAWQSVADASNPGSQQPDAQALMQAGHSEKELGPSGAGSQSPSQ